MSVTARIWIKNFKNGPDEDDYVRMFESEEILFQDQDENDVPNDNTEPDLEDPWTSLLSFREILKTIYLAKRIMEGHVDSSHSSLKEIASVQTFLQFKDADNGHQRK